MTEKKQRGKTHLLELSGKKTVCGRIARKLNVIESWDAYHCSPGGPGWPFMCKLCLEWKITRQERADEKA